MCNLQWTHKFSLDFKRPAKYLRERETWLCLGVFRAVTLFVLHRVGFINQQGMVTSGDCGSLVILIVLVFNEVLVGSMNLVTGVIMFVGVFTDVTVLRFSDYVSFCSLKQLFLGVYTEV